MTPEEKAVMEAAKQLHEDVLYVGKEIPKHVQLMEAVARLKNVESLNGRAPAYPSPPQQLQSNPDHRGLTKREAFVMAAIQGLAMTHCSERGGGKASR